MPFVSNHKYFIFFLVISACVSNELSAQYSQFEAVNFSRVNINDNFWKPRLQTIAEATLEACIVQTETKTPRIRNFEKVARNQGEKHEGIYYDDSDVYKAIEAIAYSLNNHPDEKTEATADRWIEAIAAAQLPDGYLNTWYQLGDLTQRWTDIEKHEDYNAGHLIEAAIAYYNATGKDKLLNVAIRLANHIDSTFRLANKPWFSGHQEIELALVKLFQITKNDRYLKLSEWYLQQRGKGYYTYGTNWITPDYWQDLMDVKSQKEITGHAVRAMYLYTGAADVAASTGNVDYAEAMHAVWEDVVHRNLYITGGIGSTGRNEGFSIDYDLPNSQAYAETCASVGMVLWNQRMNRLTAESKFIDVLERTLYNGALSGLSLSGDRFFYGNPLASKANHFRREWFGTACCPANIARLTASVGDYIYGVSNEGIWINLFIGNQAKIQLAKQEVPISIETNYPWEGKVKLTLEPLKKTKIKLHLRIPGWVQGNPVPGDLYRFQTFVDNKPLIRLNGKAIDYTIEKGYAIIDREWRKGDFIELDLPMEVREVIAHEKVKQNEDRVALQRGPLLYCVEGADNGGKAWNFILPENTVYQSKFETDVLGGVVMISFEVPVLVVDDESVGGVNNLKRKIKAIPYYAWNNRGQNEMQVWLPRKFKEVWVNPDH